MAKLIKLPVPPKAKEGETQIKPPYPLKGKAVVAGRVFEDGQLLVHDDTDAALIASVLCRFHGCTVEDVQEASAPASPEGTLASSATKK